MRPPPDELSPSEQSSTAEEQIPSDAPDQNMADGSSDSPSTECLSDPKDTPGNEGRSSEHENDAVAQDAESAGVADGDDPKTSKPKDPKKSKKRTAIICALAAVIIVVFLFSTHIICFHDWQDATCTEPETCSICGRTQGEPLGHAWSAATCTKPRTCKVCGATEGVALGHDPIGVTCTEDGTCSRCGATIKATGHRWTDATCTEPKTCLTCGATEGEPLGHTTSNGICERCGKEIYSTQSGSGDQVVSGISTGSDIYRVHFTNEGSSNFAVWAYDSTGSRDLLVNTIGGYDGRTLLLGTEPYSFEITSSGNWTYTIEPLGTTQQTSFSGSGDYVTDIFPATSGSWHFTHDGSSNFSVWVYTTDGRDLPVNTIGSYDGTKMLSIPSDSNAFFVITADGNWSIEPVS